MFPISTSFSLWEEVSPLVNTLGCRLPSSPSPRLCLSCSVLGLGLAGGGWGTAHQEWSRWSQPVPKGFRTRNVIF